MAYEDEDSIGLLDETEEESRKRAGLTGGVYDSGHPRVPAKSITQTPDYQTSLSPEDEQKFQSWTKESKAPWQDSPTSDYDMRGYWKAQQSGDPNAQRDPKTQHYPDTWKTPRHELFSNESMYATPGAPHWENGKLAATLPQSVAGSAPSTQPAQRHYNKLPGGGYQLAPLSEGDGKAPQSILGPSESTQPATSITAGPLDKPVAATPLGPAAQREHDLLGQGAPQYHGWKKALDILGRVTAPGRSIEQGTGLGTLGYESRLGEAATDSAREQAQAKAPLDLAYEESRTSEQKAKAEQEQAKAKALANPPQKPENLQQEYADAVTAVQRAGGDPSKDQKVQQLADAITSLQKQTPQKPDTATQEDQKYEDITARTHLGRPVSPEEKAWAGAYAQRKTLGPALTSAAADTRQQRTFTQQERMFQLHQQALSAATKSMIEAAPTVDGLASRIDPLLDKLQDELGPGEGRWTEFWAGKIGSKNPEYTKLRTDVGLLQTALMRMHVGAKGGQEMMVHFKDLIDQGKQDPDNMRAALSEIRQYAHELKQKGIAGGMSPAVLNGGEGGGASQPPREPKAGMKWQQNKKTGEYREVPVG